jgi:hypothetical protein
MFLKIDFRLLLVQRPMFKVVENNFQIFDTRINPDKSGAIRINQLNFEFRR